jgi:hypothetical protein
MGDEDDNIMETTECNSGGGSENGAGSGDMNDEMDNIRVGKLCNIPNLWKRHYEWNRTIPLQPKDKSFVNVTGHIVDLYYHMEAIMNGLHST